MKFGQDVLKSSSLNKQTAFTAEEKNKLKLEGLLPDVVESLDIQMQRVFAQLKSKTSDFECYLHLMNLLDTNETLFYKTVMSDPARFMPLIYTPTIGEACLKYHTIFQRPFGLYLSIRHKGRIRQVLQNWPEKDIRFICITDGGRILGLGDLGVNGAPIARGKLQLYTVIGQVPPKHLLPIVLDVGTDNEMLLNDPLYFGLKQKRPSSKELYSLVDEFVEAVQNVFPLCCIHFEDWKGIDAIEILDRYQDKVCCYNDDIQGTGSTVLAALLNAVKIKKEELKDQRILFLGAGAAALGIAHFIVSEMKSQGLSQKDAERKIVFFDRLGMISSDRTDLLDEQKPYAYHDGSIQTFMDAIQKIRPTFLIGVSTAGGAFTKQVIETMSLLNERPIIFALSNPTSHAECTAEEAYIRSQGRVIFGAGVQFPEVVYDGNIYYPNQVNNCFIFPALAMAVFATQAKFIPDELFVEAAHAIADQVSFQDLKVGSLYPPKSYLVEPTIKAAVRIAEMIFEHHLARVEKPSDVESFIRRQSFS